MKRYKCLVLSALLISFATMCSVVQADRGGISLQGYDVFESGQRAIVAWNGTDEILILSSDVSSNQESMVIEFLPLPSNPNISKGSESSFGVVGDLVASYFMQYARMPEIYYTWGATQGGLESVQIFTFHLQMGVHDLTVVRAEDEHELILWIENYLRDNGMEYESLPSNLEDMFSKYIEDGINFFVVDIIDANSTTRSVEPIVYELKTPVLYYPLRISSLFLGETQISLVTITSGELDDGILSKEGFQEKAQFYIKLKDLEGISPAMTNLFSQDPCLCFYEYNGSLESFSGDIKAQSSSWIMTLNVIITIFASFTVLPLPLISFLRRREACRS